MKAILIDPQDKTIQTTEIDSIEQIRQVIGFDTLASDEVGNGADRLFFDEECFIRGTTGRFQLDTLIPVAGRGLIIGVAQDGTTLSDAASDIAALKERIRFQ